MQLTLYTHDIIYSLLWAQSQRHLNSINVKIISTGARLQRVPAYLCVLNKAFATRLYKQIAIKKVRHLHYKKSIIFFVITPFLAIRVANAII
jgi:hypothetical protein